MKKVILCQLCVGAGLLTFGSSAAWGNSAPTVTNVTAAPRADGSKLVDIGYDLADARGMPRDGARLPDTVIFVDASATGANDGTSWTDAFISLKDALASAVVGACCRGSECVIATEAGCKSGDGYYLGDDTDCAGSPCATGACCSAGPSVGCDDGGGTMDESTCTVSGGTYVGGTTCSDNPSPCSVCEFEDDGHCLYRSGYMNPADRALDIRAADDFRAPPGGGMVSRICYEHGYSPSGGAPECFESPPDDDLKVVFYEDDFGLPGVPIWDSEDYPGWTGWDARDYRFGRAWRYTTPIDPPLELEGDQCYWIEITGWGTPDCWVHWLGSSDGNAYRVRDHNDSWGHEDIRSGDLVFCIDLGIAQPTTPGVDGGCGDIPVACCHSGPMCEDTGTLSECTSGVFFPHSSCAAVECPDPQNDDCLDATTVCDSPAQSDDVGSCDNTDILDPGPACSVALQDCYDGSTCVAWPNDAYRCTADTDNRLATTDGPDAGADCLWSGQTSFQADVWYSVQAPCTGEMVISMCNAPKQYDAMLAVFGDHSASPTCPGSSNDDLLACNDDFCFAAATTSGVQVAVGVGAVYLIRLGGWSGDGTAPSAGQGESQLDIGFLCDSLRAFADSPTPPSGISSSRNAHIPTEHTAAGAGTSRSPGVEIWVAQGTYMPDGGRKPVGGAHVPGSGDREATFQLVNGVALYGGFAGDEISLDERDASANETILSGDLTGDDASAPCTSDSPDCDSNGRLCVDGSCILPANNAENSYHVVMGSFADATAILDGFSITAGNADGTLGDSRGGGMMISYSGTPVIQNCRFFGNYAISTGGAMVADSSSFPTIISSSFSRNSAESSAGAMRVFGAGASIQNCVLSQNYRSALLVVNSDIVVDRCTFEQNVGPGSPAMDLQGVSVVASIYNSTFRGNAAASSTGGAIRVIDGTASFVNCTLQGNTAASGGGAMVIEGLSAMVDFINCTFTANSSPGVLHGSDASTIFTNCILWGNGYTQIQVHSGTVTVNHSLVEGGWGGPGGVGVLDVDPSFVDANGADDIAGTEDDDLRLAFGSPAIDAADTTALPVDALDLDDDGNTAEYLPLDLGGGPRVLDDPNTPDTGVPGSAVVDMGAYEFFSDCNANGLPDECDLDCGPAMGPCNIPGCGGSADCQPNDIPDECDIADCDGSLDCNDCNLNGVPDVCDDPGDSIPDTCEDWTDNGSTDNWSDGGNWDLSGEYPDNAGQDTFSVTLQDITGQVVLDVTVNIDTLRVLEGASLDVTQGDLEVVEPGGILINGTSTARENIATTVLVGNGQSITDTNMHVVNGGQLRVEGDASIELSGTLTVGAGGLYAAADGATNVSASLLAQTAEILGGSCSQQVNGGEIILTDKMSLIVSGDLVMQGSAEQVCGGARGAIAPPPGLGVGCGGNRSGSPTIDIGGQMVFTQTVTVSLACASAERGPGGSALNLAGSFVNQSTSSNCFRAETARIVLDGSAAREFEVAGRNFGPTTSGSARGVCWDTGAACGGAADPSCPTMHPNALDCDACGTNFRIGELEIGAGADVTFVDVFKNDAQGPDVQEALYVDTLTIQAGAQFTINNCSVYYNTLMPPDAEPAEILGSGAFSQLVSVVSPLPAALPHDAYKHRYLSINTTTNPGTEAALRVELISMRRCSGDLSRSCTVDDDCEAAVPGSGTCVEHTDVGSAGPWWVQAPQQEQLGCIPGPCGDEDWFARVDATPYFDTWTLSTLHLGDCEIIPVATYGIRACAPPDGLLCTDPLTIGTIAQPFVSPGFRGNYGDVVGPVDAVTEQFTPPDGFTNVVDVSAYILTNQNYGTANTPQTHPTWVDLHGLGDGNPPQYILNVSDMGQILKAFAGDAWTDDPGNMNPGQCP